MAFVFFVISYFFLSWCICVFKISYFIDAFKFTINKTPDFFWILFTFFCYIEFSGLLAFAWISCLVVTGRLRKTERNHYAIQVTKLENWTLSLLHVHSLAWDWYHQAILRCIFGLTRVKSLFHAHTVAWDLNGHAPLKYIFWVTSVWNLLHVHVVAWALLGQALLSRIFVLTRLKSLLRAHNVVWDLNGQAPLRCIFDLTRVKSRLHAHTVAWDLFS